MCHSNAITTIWNLVDEEMSDKKYEESCLCGSVKWELTAEPYSAYNCYCSMCRKLHGSAFGSYFFIHDEHFKWTSDTNTITHYKSSSFLTRSACGTCGSVVPLPSTVNDGWAIPGGCHDLGRKADSNIFTADVAPWHAITDDLPCHDAYPGAADMPTVDNKTLAEKPEGVVRGSCLCGAIEFHITEPLTIAHNCHCSRCRHARAAAHASNGFTSFDGVHFLKGEDHLKSYKVPDAQFFTQTFCDVCSSIMPRLDAGRKIAVIPLGSLDDDPGIKPVDHIFTNHKAGWHEITYDLPQFEEGLPN